MTVRINRTVFSSCGSPPRARPLGGTVSRFTGIRPPAARRGRLGTLFTINPCESSEGTNSPKPSRRGKGRTRISTRSASNHPNSDDGNSGGKPGKYDAITGNSDTGSRRYRSSCGRAEERKGFAPGSTWPLAPIPLRHNNVGAVTTEITKPDPRGRTLF